MDLTWNDPDTSRILQPHGPSPSFKFPAEPDVIKITNKVLTKVDPCNKGRIYTLTKQECRSITKKLPYFPLCGATLFFITHDPISVPS